MNTFNFYAKQNSFNYLMKKVLTLMQFNLQDLNILNIH